MKTNYYIAIETSQQDELSLQCLSNRIMRVNDSIWLIDMNSFFDFWQQKSMVTKINLYSLWKQTLINVFDKHQNQNLPTLRTGFKASLADNPWCALLLLQQMIIQKISGFLKFHSGFGKELITNLSWETWWQSLELYGELYHKADFTKFNLRQYKKNLTLFQRSVRRLNLQKTMDLQTLSFAGMQRRFGACLAEIWQAIFHPLQTSSLFHNTSFPWMYHQFPSLFQIQRGLEYSITHWQQIEPLLLEDLDRLAMLIPNSAYTNSIRWKLNFESKQDVELILNFRHPYLLSSHLGKQKAAILQALYCFNSYAASLLPDHLKSRIEDNHLTLPQMIGWQLIIDQYILLPPRIHHLFQSTQSPSQQQEEQFYQLSNELPIALQRFHLQSNWTIHQCYQQETTHLKEPLMDLDSSLKVMAQKKPLYIAKQDSMIKKEQIECAVPLEYNMNTWWTSDRHEPEHLYFKILHNKKWLWATHHNSEGDWQIHGFFH